VWEWLPRAHAHPSEVDIEMVGNRETQHGLQTQERDLETATICDGTDEVLMMVIIMVAAARWSLLEDNR
jgi:hypothetical protein